LLPEAPDFSRESLTSPHESGNSSPDGPDRPSPPSEPWTFGGPGAEGLKRKLQQKQMDRKTTYSSTASFRDRVEQAVKELLETKQNSIVFGEHDEFILTSIESVKDEFDEKHAPMGSEEVDGVEYEIYAVQE